MQRYQDHHSIRRAAVLTACLSLGLLLPAAAVAQQGNYSTAYQGTGYSNAQPTMDGNTQRAASSYEGQPQMARAQSCLEGRSQAGCDMAEQKAKAARDQLAPLPRMQCENFINNGKLRSYNACQP